MPDTPVNPYPKIFAIDPGVNGGWAVLGHDGEFIDAGELPRFERSLNAVELGTLLKVYQPGAVIIEKVGPMPKQGLSSTWIFGVSYGLCIGVAAGASVPVSMVSASRWKVHFHLIGKPKDAARELAIRLYPLAAGFLTLKKHCGRADAMLMARYALDLEMGRRFV
jgi:crossover junction endodeoxyribonuclease RuvC